MYDILGKDGVPIFDHPATPEEPWSYPHCDKWCQTCQRVNRNMLGTLGLGLRDHYYFWTTQSERIKKLEAEVARLKSFLGLRG